jgi:pheromone shutdown protein TraB
LQFERYLVTAFSLMLVVVLVVGAAGYAGIHGLLSSTAATPKLAHLERVDREAEADNLVTPAAIALALIAGFLVAATARGGSPRRYHSIRAKPPVANSQYTTPRNTSSSIICK